jgi:enoyl-CoA hydratase/carnithine racemase
MSEEPVLYEMIDGIAILTLNNPAKRNALSLAVLAALKSHLGSIKDDPTVRVVVVRSQGPVFSSGHDLTEMTGREQESYTHLFAACSEVMEAIRMLPKPVIAQVQGLATAAGCELVATCDLAVASETASFATPGVLMGLFCTTPAVAVSRVVPLKKAMEMLLTGTPVPAREALESGLINRVVPPEELEERVMALARQISSGSALAVAVGKPAFYQQLEMERPVAYELAQRVMIDNLLAGEAQEGIAARLEKREPRWDGITSSEK